MVRTSCICFGYLVVLVLLSALHAQTMPATAPAKVVEVSVGSAKVRLPVPAGFMKVEEDIKEVKDGLKLGVPPDNKLLARFIVPNSLRPEAKDGSTVYRYIMVQTFRRAPDRAMTAGEFAKMKAGLAKSIEQRLSKAKDETNKLLKEMTAGPDGSRTIAIGDMVMLGTFLTQDNAIGYTSVTYCRIADGRGEQKDVPMASTNTIARINGRIVFLYVCSTYVDEESVKWTQNTSSGWLTEIAKANN